MHTTTDFSATADVGLTSELRAATSVGVQYYTRRVGTLRATADEFAGPGLNTITSANRSNVTGNGRVEVRTLGSYVQETLSWQDRIFLTGAVRVDNNSAFGSEINLIAYPKASLSWVMSEANWFDDVAPSWINTFRLRAAWGQSGEAPPAFSALRTWRSIAGPLNTAGVLPSTIGNPNLTAEVGQEAELGFDADVLDGRLGLQFTYYHKLTKDAILLRDPPPSTGFTGARYVNAGKILNQGVEGQLNALLLDRTGFQWDVGFKISYNDSEVLRLSGEPGDTMIIYGSWQSMGTRVGYPLNSWFGVDVVSADLDPETGLAVNAMCRDGSGGMTPCFDENGMAIAPRVFLGRAMAPLEMSIYTNIGIGQDLNLYLMFTSKQGHKRLDNTYRQRRRLYDLTRQNVYPEERDPVIQAAVQSSDQIIDAWVIDASFVRLKTASITYELPDGIIDGLGVSRAELQLAGRNLLTFTDWRGTDPEVSYSSGGRRFIYQNLLPLPQQIVTTIRFSF